MIMGSTSAIHLLNALGERSKHQRLGILLLEVLLEVELAWDKRCLREE